MNGQDSVWDPQAVRAQVARILASSSFDASDRNRRFLSFVTEETLQGRGDRIKAFSIATSVFGRDESFDPQLDPIVRMEARVLRRSLEHYYLTAGRADPIMISIPKGAYVPQFKVLEPPAGPAPKPAAAQASRRNGPSILVLPFDDESETPASGNFVRGLTRQIIVGLTRFSGLFVFGPETTFLYGVEPIGADTVSKLGVDFTLSGGVSLETDRFAIDVLLTDARSGRHIWGETFRRDPTPEGIVAARDKAASAIAGFLAQPYGVIYNALAREIEGKPPSELMSYEVVMKFYNYARTYKKDELRLLCEKLEAVVASEPHYPTAAACLSLAYCDIYRFNYNIPVPGGDILERALDLAKSAIEMAPFETRGYQALSLALWFQNDVQASLSALRHACSLNPNDTEIMGELGLRYAVLADWNRAVPLLEQCYERNPAQPNNHRLGLALFHFAHGRFEEALAEARKLDVPNVIYGHLLVAAAAARAGHTTLAKDALARIHAIDPLYGQRVAADLRARNVNANLIHHISAALRLAGMDIPARQDGDGAYQDSYSV